MVRPRTLNTLRGLACLTTLAVVLPIGALTPAQPSGLARSDADFSVRLGASDAPTTAREALIRPGDLVEAGDRTVRVDLKNGHSLLLDKSSAARIPAAEGAEIVRGNLVASRSETAPPVQVSYRDLQFVSADGAKGGSAIALRTIDETRVQAIAAGDSYTVTQTGREPIQVASLGAGDEVLFTLYQGVWTVSAPQEGNARLGADPVSRGALNVDREKAVFWWRDGALVALGAGALGFTLYAIEEDLDNDSEHGDRDGGSGPDFSQISSSND